VNIRKEKIIMANKKFDNDPIIVALREKYPKNGPDPMPGETMEHWAERFMNYVRKIHGWEENTDEVS
jgi:hypothetical protein